MTLHDIYRLLQPGFRARRFSQFKAMLQPKETMKLLDLGGIAWHWDQFEIKLPIVVINPDIPEGIEAYEPQIRSIKGDATRLEYPDSSFDIVYSNSVIEHLGTWENQQAFAREARRVGGKLWIQTPARWFPIEPHLVAPLVHYLPKVLQRPLLRWFTVWGWMTKPTPAKVRGFLAEVRLLTHREMRQLFPDCQIVKERLFGLTKSFIAVRL